MAYLDIKKADNVILLRSLIDKCYDTGYYAGNGRIGKPEFEAAKRDRDAMWHELESRLTDIDLSGVHDDDLMAEASKRGYKLEPFLKTDW